MDPEEVDCTELERRLQDVLNDVGCECMAEVLEKGDTKAPVVEYAGERWGNRRDSPSTYKTVFGEVKVVRSIYSRGVTAGEIRIPSPPLVGSDPS